jgi:hypothetical protein
VDQIFGTTPTDAPIEAQDVSLPADASISTEPSGFGARGRARRRTRFLRKARELAYRDLGGLVFNLHRFGQRNDALVMAKLTTLAHIDVELRTLEATLGDSRPVTVLREAGITACARCAAIHSSEDHFCPNCGLSVGRHADLPIAGAAASAVAQAASAGPQAPAPAPAQPTPAPPAPAQAQTPAPASTRAVPAPARAPASEPMPAAPVESAAPAGRSPTPPAGRSPTPPATPTAPAATPPAQAQPGSPGGEEPTEILRPPTANQ